MGVARSTSLPVDGEEFLAQVRRAWASLLDRSDAIADDITLTLMERDKQWYDFVPELQADVRQSTREHVRRGIRTLAGLAGEHERAVDVWRETGRRRAQQGVPMELVLNAYTLGTRVLWEALVDQRDDPAVGIDGEVLLVAGQRAWSALDVQNATLIDSYRREAARLQRRDLHRQHRLLDALVAGRGSDPEFAAEVREVLGVAMDERVACVVAHFDGSLDAPLRAPEDHLERAGLMSYWHVRGDLYFGLVQLGESNVADLVDMLGQISGGRVGVAEAPEGLGGFCTAYQLAAGTVETLPRAEPGIAEITDRLPEVLLTSSPDVTNLLVERTLGPLRTLPEQQAEVLLSTLAALIAHNGSPTRAAEELYCHRNTVIYRVRQIGELTCRDLAEPRDRLLFSLALMAADE